MAFLYPLTEGRALLSAYVPKALAHELSEREDGRSLLRVFEQLPDAPPLRQARLASRHLGYTDYPNRWRSPTHDGVAFVGDAALSLDPMSGVGCAFGLHSADLLVTHTAAALRDGTSSDLAHGLGEYERSFRAFFAPHAKGIVADSLVAKSAATIANVYGRVVQHPELQRHFIALTGRLITPGAFQKAFLSAGSPRRAASMHRSETP
jgi:flavin-dependent dehydrogenase